ncbi:MAG: redoxin domain-containing protein [Actinobacteria bacterium]|nr:redoxin domain-containing protein [Actinomycetota bacterium]
MRSLAIALLLILGASACAGEVAGNTPERGMESTPDEGAGDGVAREAPDFSFETFEGETFSLAELRGTPVVLNFWESW